ncbi:hypothetical protein, partial [Enterobacter hormaechei]
MSFRSTERQTPNSFHIHCQDHRGKAVYRKKFTRPKL